MSLLHASWALIGGFGRGSSTRNSGSWLSLATRQHALLKAIQKDRSMRATGHRAFPAGFTDSSHLEKHADDVRQYLDAYDSLSESERKNAMKLLSAVDGGEEAEDTPLTVNLPVVTLDGFGSWCNVKGWSEYSKQIGEHDDGGGLHMQMLSRTMGPGQARSIERATLDTLANAKSSVADLFRALPDVGYMMLRGDTYFNASGSSTLGFDNAWSQLHQHWDDFTTTAHSAVATTGGGPANFDNIRTDKSVTKALHRFQTSLCTVAAELASVYL